MEKQRTTFLLPLMAGLAVFAQLVANVMSSLVAPFSVGVFVLSGGFWTFPIVYVLSDLIQEVYGYKASRKVSWLTGACALAASVVFYLGVFFTPSESLNTLGGASWIITIAGFLAAQAGSWVNDIVFTRLLNLPRLPRFWLSSIAGEIIDSTIFVFMGLVVVFKLPFEAALINIVSQVLFKMVVELAWSPASIILAPVACTYEGVLPARERADKETDRKKLGLFG